MLKEIKNKVIAFTLIWLGLTTYVSISLFIIEKMSIIDSLIHSGVGCFVALSAVAMIFGGIYYLNKD